MVEWKVRREFLADGFKDCLLCDFKLVIHIVRGGIWEFLWNSEGRKKYLFFQHDYRKWPGAARADIIMPEKRSFLGEGPMSSQTTQKHDYTPKGVPKVDPFLPSNNLRLSNKRMEGEKWFKLSKDIIGFS